MNAKLEIYSLNSTLFVDLNNVLIEDFSDGYMIHADNGFSMTIPHIDVASTEITENNSSFWMKDQSKIIFSWT